MSIGSARNQRADARRSRARIIDAAFRVLDVDPEASVETIASAAGMTRQTVYAHFPTRQHLLVALLDQITDETVAAMDAVDLDSGPAADALLRLLDAGFRTTERYAVLLRKLATVHVGAEDDRERHDAVADRLRRVIAQGQRSGEFDDQLSPDWLVAVTIRLGHLAGEEIAARRMSRRKAMDALELSLLRVLGVDTHGRAR